MENLEHEIKNAFAEHDNNVRFSGKDEMWNRLDKTMHKSKSVAPFWRIAAVFAGLLLVSGAIAGIVVHNKLHADIGELSNQNVQLKITIDSLLSRPIEIQTETEVVEKVVYRDRVLKVNSDEVNNEWETKYQQLKDSTDSIITQNKNSYSDELQQLKAELESVNEKLIAIQDQSDESEHKVKEPFQLKSERVELGIENVPVTKSQRIEVKIFPKSFTGNKNNINKSILNNLP